EANSGIITASAAACGLICRSVRLPKSEPLLIHYIFLPLGGKLLRLAAPKLSRAPNIGQSEGRGTPLFDLQIHDLTSGKFKMRSEAIRVASNLARFPRPPYRCSASSIRQATCSPASYRQPPSAQPEAAPRSFEGDSRRL